MLNLCSQISKTKFYTHIWFKSTIQYWRGIGWTTVHVQQEYFTGIKVGDYFRQKRCIVNLMIWSLNQKWCNHHNLSLKAACHLKAERDRCLAALAGPFSAPYLPIFTLSSGEKKVDTQGAVPDSSNSRFMSNRPWCYKRRMVLTLPC